jgi:predicted mannosyl-3-phosphoglycerate phosphatase (HAD superfamily)
LRTSTTVVFCFIDDLIPVSGKPLTGFPGFLDALNDAHIPCVWITDRNRHELDSSLRKLAHAEPFIAEGGSAAYIPEDYFHLKPARTVRLGRFICIPAAKAQPAAEEALGLLAEETGVTVVPLRSLSPRELVQNTGLHRDAAEFLIQRDFDELFFFAGASEKDIERFRARATHHKLSLRPRGPLWSLAVHSSVSACVKELRKLYDRALHTHAFSIGVSTAPEASGLFAACDRAILLTDRSSEAQVPPPGQSLPPACLPLFSSGTWARALEMIRQRQFS